MLIRLERKQQHILIEQNKNKFIASNQKERRDNDSSTEEMKNIRDIYAVSSNTLFRAGNRCKVCSYIANGEKSYGKNQAQRALTSKQNQSPLIKNDARRGKQRAKQLNLVILSSRRDLYLHG